jgi:hypothetical protein
MLAPIVYFTKLLQCCRPGFARLLPARTAKANFDVHDKSRSLVAAGFGFNIVARILVHRWVWLKKRSFVNSSEQH